MVWIYDIETYPNIFTFVFKNVKTGEVKIFEFSERKNELKGLITFISQKGLALIGYSNLHFDYPVLHYILITKNITLKSLYNYVQNKVINSEYPAIRDYNIKIPQLDLYKINHYDNKARRTSLKWLEFTLRWKNLQDLPFKPGTIIPVDKFDFLIEYNINDVLFTLEFYKECIDAIVFRENMTRELGINVMNYSDVKIGEYINQITYQKLSGIPFSSFRYMKTTRDLIEVKDLIPDYIKFKTKSFQDFLEEIRTKSFYLDEPFERHLSIGNMNIKFAKGGLHSEDSPRIIKCKDKWILKEKDVGSMYPASIINGKFYPEHLGQAWYEGIKQLYEERAYKLKPEMKKLDRHSKEYKYLNSKQESYKLAMNGGGYGKTGSEFSWQYDPLIMLKVTFKGQLSLLMLLEEYYLLGVELISANTDGVVLHYPEELSEKVLKIHKDWESITKYILEDTSYQQIIFRDVNNYIAEIIDEKTKKREKIKYKGCFEIDQEFHKNNSQRIVAIALKEYFINDIPIEDVIYNLGYRFINSKDEEEKTSIFDYCSGVKKGNNTYAYAFIEPNKREDIYDKVIRYYVSNTNTKMYKLYDNKDNRIEAVNKGFNITPFMKYYESDDYGINHLYYINECNKIINPIKKGTKNLDSNNPKQLKLF